MILAGIVLYNPDIDRLKNNIEAIEKQVNKIVFIDNSTEQSEKNINIVNQILKESQFIYINNNGNVGIAKALNQIMEYAFNKEYEWVLTLDQDTICPQNLIENYKQYLSIPDVGIICPKIKDRNFEFINNDSGKTDFIDYCITSAALTSTLIWKKIGGFSEELFIDYVDFDYCLNLKKNNYKILRVNSSEILHEIGHAKQYCVFGKTILTFNHSPIRNYYIVRNKLICAYKYKNYVNIRKEKKEIITHIIKVIFLEKNRLCNLRYVYKGYKDGKRMVDEMNEVIK